MACMIVAAHGGASPLWAGFDGEILAGPLALMQVAHQLLPQDHTDLMGVKVQQKKDSAFSSYKGEPTPTYCC